MAPINTNPIMVFLSKFSEIAANIPVMGEGPDAFSTGSSGSKKFPDPGSAFA